jgi:4-hydroxybenzoyl-CoA thioesterase/acyl-CoA thioester hydrolase
MPTADGTVRPGDSSSAAFTTRRRVEFRDTDAAGIVHFSAFFLWMESAEHELLRSIGTRIFERQAAPDGAEVDVSWPRVSVSCDYASAVRFGDEVDIAVTVDAVGRASITYGFQFSLAGLPVARGRVVAVRCQLRPGLKPEPVPIPDDLVARFSRYRRAD